MVILMINCIGSHSIYDIDSDDTINIKYINLLENELKAYISKYVHYSIH